MTKKGARRIVPYAPQSVTMPVQNERLSTKYAVSALGFTVTPADTGRLKLSVTSISFDAATERFVTAKPSVP